MDEQRSRFDILEQYGFEFKGEIDMMGFSYVHENTFDVSIALEMKPNHKHMMVWNTDQDGSYSYDENPIHLSWETLEEFETFLVCLLRITYKNPREHYSLDS